MSSADRNRRSSVLPHQRVGEAEQQAYSQPQHPVEQRLGDDGDVGNSADATGTTRGVPAAPVLFGSSIDWTSAASAFTHASASCCASWGVDPLAVISSSTVDGGCTM